MRLPFIALLVSVLTIPFTIAACQTAFTPSQLASFQKACSAGRTAFTVFETLKDTGRFPARTVNYVEGAWAGVSGLCANPPADVSTAAVQVAAALVVINNAIRKG